MTVDELMDKVAERHGRSTGEPCWMCQETVDGPMHRTHQYAMAPEKKLEATCWFIAVQQAKAVFDSYSVKDLARDIVAGHVAGPYKEVAHVECWIEDCDPDKEEGYWDWLDAALDEHFGVKR